MSGKINKLLFMRPWAVREDILRLITVIFERHTMGEKLSNQEIEAIAKSNKKEDSGYEVKDGIAYVPIYGVISKRSNMVENISQPVGTAIQQIRTDFKLSMEDNDAKTIIFEIDSPGGSVDGVAELSDMIFQARGTKKMIAYANGQMDSAAYWIGSSADKVYASKGSEVGSIGVFSVIDDYTVANHNTGLRVEIIKAGKDKAAGHPDKPFTQEDREIIQEEVDTYYGLFTEAVKRNRNMSAENLENVATGEIFIGQKALDAGLIDGVMDYDTLINSHRVLSTTIQSRAAVEKKEIKKQALDKKEIKREGKLENNANVLIIETATKEWDTDPKVRQEFSSKEAYIAYKKAEARGGVRIFNRQ